MTYSQVVQRLIDSLTIISAAFNSSAIGLNTISDFNRSQGDKIVLDKTNLLCVDASPVGDARRTSCRRHRSNPEII
ncbi:hypothetical protein [Nostoc sp. NMS9]|uniref:hypothetical protein n=1 Tax=Nostoc sp. NMS9 TaxID=2815393 RepID=UPI0025F18FC9|nr:hypothetical protein [Nostoc sp. NMS9]MBN3940008.1 hypothetical protein [Nostoc sp. NMS9]